MAIIKCKMCGGDIQLAEDKTFGTCEYCGSVMTLPKISDEQRAAAFNRGNHFRRAGEFDKALAVYERIVAEDDDDAEAHWCCALCRFGIEYVEDPATYEWLPTCHRASFDSFLEDVDYLAAVEHSDGITRRQYQKDAAKIAEVQRGILATSQNTEPYDVFISYKELDAEGNRTRDSILAQDIYYQLTEKGWRVFFSRISLEDVPGTQYEPYIFAALNSAKVMIVVGTSAENLNAVWVKNEWSRYLSLMRKDRSKLLLPCYRDMDPYDLPEQLSVLMSYDMGKIGFIQDLIRGVDKVLNAEKPKEAAPAPASAPVQERVIVQQTGGGPNVTALLKRGQQALEDGDWDKARGFYDQVLSMDAENAEAFLGLALAGSRSKDIHAYLDALCTYQVNIETKLLKQDQAHIKDSIEKTVVPGYCEGKELAKLYDFSVSYPVKQNEEHKLAQQAKARFNSDRNLSRAFRYASGESKQKLDALKKALYDRLDTQTQAAELSDQKALEQAKAELAAKTEAADRRAEELSRTAQEKREADYQEACRQAEIAKDDFEFTNAGIALKRVGRYKDAAERAKECEEKAAEIKARREQAEREVKEKAETVQRKKNRRAGIIFGSVAVAVIAILLLVTQVIVPRRNYKTAVNLFAEGRYAEAAAVFDALGSYSDSTEQAKMAREAELEQTYDHAKTLMEEGKYEEAKTIFEELGDYNDSHTQVLEIQFREAEALFEDGYYDEAKAAFTDLHGYSDSELMIEKCEGAVLERQYQDAMALYTKKSYLEAAKAFEKLDGYKDSDSQAKKCIDALFTSDLTTEQLKYAIDFFKNHTQQYKPLSANELRSLIIAEGGITFQDMLGETCFFSKIEDDYYEAELKISEPKTASWKTTEQTVYRVRLDGNAEVTYKKTSRNYSVSYEKSSSCCWYKMANGCYFLYYESTNNVNVYFRVNN